MTREEILGKIKKDVLLFLDQGLDHGKLSESSRFIEDMDYDSLDQVEIIMYAEDFFHIEIEDDEAEKVLTLGDLVDLVEKHIGG